MSPLLSQPVDELDRLARHALELSHELRDFRDEQAGYMDPDDFDYMTELGLELAAYALILRKSPIERATWLRKVLKIAGEVLQSVSQKMEGEGA